MIFKASGSKDLMPVKAFCKSRPHTNGRLPYPKVLRLYVVPNMDRSIVSLSSDVIRVWCSIPTPILGTRVLPLRRMLLHVLTALLLQLTKMHHEEEEALAMCRQGTKARVHHESRCALCDPRGPERQGSEKGRTKKSPMEKERPQGAARYLKLLLAE